MLFPEKINIPIIRLKDLPSPMWVGTIQSFESKQKEQAEEGQIVSLSELEHLRSSALGHQAS